jgi:hypothetical protein
MKVRPIWSIHYAEHEYGVGYGVRPLVDFVQLYK